MSSVQAWVECAFDVIPACWYLHLLGVAITSIQGGPRMQQYEWASVKIWRSPHSHHSPPEPDASHTPTVTRQGQCIESQSDYNVCAVIHSLQLPRKTLGRYEHVSYEPIYELFRGKCVTLLCVLAQFHRVLIALAVGMHLISAQTIGQQRLISI